MGLGCFIDEALVLLTEGWMISSAGLISPAGLMPPAGSMADRCFQKVRQFQTLSIETMNTDATHC